MSQLICQNLSVGYDGKPVINDLNITVNAGDYLCIVGENGSGKTTLMRTILGLLPPIGGKIISENDADKNTIGYLPQQTAVQKDFPASVWEIVLSGFQGRCGLRPYYSRQEKAIAKDNIRKMHLSQLTKSCFRELSGGQQQRVLLARALCAAKKVLLLDEPVAGLDPKVTEEMYGHIDTLNKKEHMTIIMITHDVHASLRYASHILHIGREVFFGTKDAYLKSGLCHTLTSRKEDAEE